MVTKVLTNYARVLMFLEDLVSLPEDCGQNSESVGMSESDGGLESIIGNLSAPRRANQSGISMTTSTHSTLRGSIEHVVLHECKTNWVSSFSQYLDFFRRMPFTFSKAAWQKLWEKAAKAMQNTALPVTLSRERDIYFLPRSIMTNEKTVNSNQEQSSMHPTIYFCAEPRPCRQGLFWVLLYFIM